MKGVNAHIHKVVITKNQSNCFLFLAVDILFFETSKFGNAIIDVGYKIARLHPLEFAQCERFGLRKLLSTSVPMKTLENLVICIANNFYLLVDKTLAQRKIKRLKFEFRMYFFKNTLQPLNLSWLLSGNKISKALQLMFQ